MSHPDPKHDRENEYPSDLYRPKKSKAKALHKAKEAPLQRLKKLVGSSPMDMLGK